MEIFKKKIDPVFLKYTSDATDVIAHVTLHPYS